MAEFATLTLPEHIRRNSVVPEAYWNDGYLERLDRETLWYDAIWGTGLLSLVAPPLNNLERWLRRAELFADGRPIKIHRIRKQPRHVVIECKVPMAPQTLTLQSPEWTVETPVSPTDFDRFRGKNVGMYVSKNDDLGQMADHARFHRDTHGMDALLVFDNGSDVYSVADIEDVMAPLGLTLRVVSAPFKYAAMGKKPHVWTEKYLQTALYNIARLRMLGAARAVLVCDVDELVMTTGPSVFDVAAASWTGMVQIAGFWHFPSRDQTPPYRHDHHIYQPTPPAPCSPKWCIGMQGFLAGASWDVHGLTRFRGLRRFPHKDFSFLHCRSIGTGWKRQPPDYDALNLALNPKAQAALEVLSR